MSTLLPAIIGLAIRTVVGRWGYSGENDSPMFGDFEAQRHWMEVTTSLPIGEIC
jgi:alpha-1,3-glucosyltransferase